jgi:hypothetical protein
VIPDFDLFPVAERFERERPSDLTRRFLDHRPEAVPREPWIFAPPPFNLFETLLWRLLPTTEREQFLDLVAAIDRDDSVNITHTPLADGKPLCFEDHVILLLVHCDDPTLAKPHLRMDAIRIDSSCRSAHLPTPSNVSMCSDAIT